MLMLNSIGLAVVRGLKLFRLKQLNLYFDLRDMRARKNTSIRTVQASIYILLATHFLGCFWLFIGRVDPQQDKNWMHLVAYDQYPDVPDF
jgi:hypothetical protein